MKARPAAHLRKGENKIDYGKIINNFSWLITRNQNYILSPDSDGFLCALLLTNLLGGKVVGFYDGKVALVDKNINASDCIFLDVDINRVNIKSIGHHMVVFNKRLTPPNFHYAVNCVQPNILRGLDGRTDFQRKYPFGTIHLLISILHKGGFIKSLPKNSIWPLLFTDGVWNNLFGYTENCIEWINYLGINREDHILNSLFCSKDHSFYEIMEGLNRFLRVRDGFNAEGYLEFGGHYLVGGRNKRTGDKLRLSDSTGSPINIEKEKGENIFKVHEKEKNRIEGFIKTMAIYLNFKYIPDMWIWNNFKLLRFTKKDFSHTTLTNVSFMALMAQNPLSLAMTDGQNIEYTIEKPNKLS